jgi:hypothetical protein
MNQPTGKTHPPRPDPLINEVRALRKEDSDPHGNNVDRPVNDLRQVNLQLIGRIVRMAPPWKGHG